MGRGNRTDTLLEEIISAPAYGDLKRKICGLEPVNLPVLLESTRVVKAMVKATRYCFISEG